MFFDQLMNLCKEKNTTPTKFVTEVLHLSSSKVTAWKSGSIPKYEILNAIANYFDVSVGTLFDGRKNNIELLTTDEQELLNNYSKLTDDSKEEISARVEELANKDTHKEPENRPAISKSISNKTNVYEIRLLNAFRMLSYEEQIELTARAETMSEKSKGEENVG